MSDYRVTLAAIALALTAAAGAAAQDVGFGAGTPETRYFRVESAVFVTRANLFHSIADHHSVDHR